MGVALVLQTLRAFSGVGEPTRGLCLCCGRRDQSWLQAGRRGEGGSASFFGLRFPRPPREAKGPEPGDPRALKSREAGVRAGPLLFPQGVWLHFEGGPGP